ncbi:hypothetical protein J437_LFUL009978, partial [Ladona fulva]
MQMVEKRGLVVRKPSVVIDYNQTMGELCVWNSFILYKKTGGKCVHLDYRLDVIEKMIEVYHPSVTSPKVGGPLAGPQPRRLTERHFPDVIPATEKKVNPTRKCNVCSHKRDAKGKMIQRET